MTTVQQVNGTSASGQHATGQPLQVSFSSRVELTVHSAFLASAGVFQCDPIAQISLVSIFEGSELIHHSSDNSSSALPFSRSAISPHWRTQVLGRSKQHLFTSRPEFNETLSFSIPADSLPLTLPPDATRSTSSTIRHHLVITFVDERGTCFGEATCPMSLTVPGRGGAFLCEAGHENVPTDPPRLMLRPRNVFDPRDANHVKDVKRLEQLKLDDFGHVTLSWKVDLQPHGGAVGVVAGLNCGGDGKVVPFPLGLALKATWLAPSGGYHRGAQYSTSVEFSGPDRFVFDSGRPIFLTVKSAHQLSRAVFHCTVQNVVDARQSADIRVEVPMPPLVAQTVDRDIWWTCPVRSPAGNDFGLLLVSIRLTSRPLDGNSPMCPELRCTRINDPLHQMKYGHVAMDWQRPPPETPCGAFQPLFWESDDHVQRAMQRRWRRDCITDAQPTARHVRHIFDALLGRTALDAGVAKVASVLFGRPAASVTSSEYKQMLISCAFHANDTSTQEAARFCFVALRGVNEFSVALEDICFMLEHSLLGATVDMPETEIRRRVTDIFATPGANVCATSISFEDFSTFFVHNYGMWYELGVPLVVEGVSENLLTSSIADAAAATPAASTAHLAGRTPPASHPDDGDQWRTFVVQIHHTKRSFSVTAHVNDTVGDVKTMLESGTAIPASRQHWALVGSDSGTTALQSTDLVGATSLSRTGTSGQVPKVVIREEGETVRLIMWIREKNKRWEVRMSPVEKVLKLRAAVQQKTMIPLSRCQLHARPSRSSSPVVLVDRHSLLHYGLADGDTIEVSFL